MLTFYDLRHACGESAHFELYRPSGYPSYTFLHFFNPVDILVKGEIVRTLPHACIVYNIDTPQKFYSPQAFTNDYIHFGEGGEEILQKYGIEVDTLYYPSNPKVLSIIIQEMEQIFFSDKPFRSELMEVKFHELLIKFSRAVTSPDPTGVNVFDRSHFIELRLYILSKPEYPWTVAEMAAMANLCKSRFYTLYKNIFGRAPMADLIQARIYRAKNLLAYSDMSIPEIATSLGYINVTHFRRQFKSFTGIAPGTFRKQNQFNILPPSPVTPDEEFISTSDALSYHLETRTKYPEYRSILRKESNSERKSNDEII